MAHSQVKHPNEPIPYIPLISEECFFKPHTPWDMSAVGSNQVHRQERAALTRFNFTTLEWQVT